MLTHFLADVEEKRDLLENLKKLKKRVTKGGHFFH